MKIEKIAIPVFNNRISPLFDVAGEFRIIEDHSGNVNEGYSIDTSELREHSIVTRLEQEGVKVIICGAVSRCVANFILLKNIDLVPGVIGAVDDVLRAYLDNDLEGARFVMPGNRRRGCKYSKK
ncbi:MAG: hypothetical protein GY754_10700 [bacterium]|nr:hypothetical protein [bacterium]